MQKDEESNYLKSVDEISYCYRQIVNIQSINCSNYSFITRINLNHCHLQSLQGIQSYPNLSYLNIKYNNLSNPHELYRIQNKGLVKEINIQGNDIQHYSLCSFIVLRKNGFTNLKYLNGKDYTKWGAKRVHKNRKVKDIYKKIVHHEKDMIKTLKRAKVENVRNKNLIYGYQENEDEENSCNQSVSPKKSTRNRHPSFTHQYEDNQQNLSALKQISLSNANIIRSTKAYNSSIQKYENCKTHFPLKIDTSEDHIQHLPLTQPTATFASQRQKENYYPSQIPFRSQRDHQKSAINIIFENDDDEDQEPERIYTQFYSEYDPKITLRRSCSEIQLICQELENQKQQMAITQYLKFLRFKAFVGLKKQVKQNWQDRPCKAKIF